MYRQILLAGALAVAATAAPAATPWTHCFAEGEDASSRHYYFFLDPGSGVERVRWVWNGGCCNPPEVTDYNLRLPGQSGAVQISHLNGERKDAPTLIRGGDAPLSLVRKYDLILSRTAPNAPGLTLDAHQATDLNNLLNLLAGERPERPPEGCPTIEREPDPADHPLPLRIH
ncbi:MAG: hypothetical protein GX805_08365 [Gammaproteobacteria bacterium]|jgi:hypothetical protein|nr:hypothetical protein [Gammaproteobacteria bacterium]